MDNEALAKLIEDMSASLENEMRESAARIERAVLRPSSMFVAGTGAIGGLEKTIQPHDSLIADLQARVSQLEKRH